MKQKNHKTASAFTLIVSFICLAIVGMSLIPLLPVKLSPSHELPSLTVSFSMPGNSARVIETEVTSKLEGALSRINGVRKIRSTSDNGSGSLRIEIDKHSDTELVRFKVSTVIRQIWSQLPEGVSYPYLSTQHSDDQSARPFMTYTLNAPATPILIQNYGENYIKPMLSAIKGIYKIELSGATPMEWKLVYDNRLLQQLGLSADDVEQAIREYYDGEFLSICQADAGGEWIRVARTPATEEEGFHPSSIYVQTQEGEQVALDKLVTVVHAEEEPNSYFRINGLNSIYLSITADETANQLTLASQIKEVMGKVQRQMPPGYEVHISYDATEYISKELNTNYFRTAVTVLILLLFVAVITLNLRYLFLIVVSLAINMAIAFIFYYLCGVDIQLYSLAGITISLNLVIDNTIVMTDHILHRRNLKAFMSILAATLTTIGALAIIFFMDERVRLNLQDFAAVVIINLAVSLFVALFFVPALIERIRLRRHSVFRHSSRVKRGAVYFTRFYNGMVRVMCRYKAIAYVVLVLAFGLPVFLLPEKIEHPEQKGEWAAIYNKVFDNATYRETIKPITDKWLGGTLRLFVEKVYNGSYFGNQDEEVVLSVTATLPNGSTLEQMNVLIKQMETYLSSFQEIRQFQTSVYDARHAGIRIFFKKAYEHSGFPYVLKSNIISKALTLGGGSWNVYGLQDQGFSNDVRESAGSFRVEMYGYNYDELSHWADEMKKLLLSHRRIKEVLINSEFSYWKDDYDEFILQFDKEKMAKEKLTASLLFAALRPVFMSDRTVGSIVYDNQNERLSLSSVQSKDYDIWGLMEIPFEVNGRLYKLSDFAAVRKEQVAKKIVKENQQYVLCLQFEYIGAHRQGEKILEKDVNTMKASLPMGYTIENKSNNWYWGGDDSGQYKLLFIVIAIIFFISAILFNSLKQPLAIIGVIPISYIGVFLTFYLFGLTFDQGGFAAFVLLCGITVNASIYILNEYNAIRRRYPRQRKTAAYVKAWNVKVIPIFLTVTSTVLGFLPFMIGEKESFWFSLAAGTIGGLVMSVIGIFFYLPLFLLPKYRKKNTSGCGNFS